MLRRSLDNLELQKRNLRLFFVTLMSLLIFFTISYVGRQIERVQVQAEAVLWTQRIEDARAQKAELADQLAYVKSDAYVDRVAREQLGLTQPGDSVVILVPNPAPPPIDESTAQTVQSQGGGSPSEVFGFTQDASPSMGGTLSPDALSANSGVAPEWWKHVVQFLGFSDTN